MTTARQIIGDALSFHLNRLSPGETLDADTASLCLGALNDVADEWNGGGSLLFREVLVSAAVSGASGTLGTTWASVASGTRILGATYNDGDTDIPLGKLTLRQYHEQIADKTVSDRPEYFAHDGAATVYFWPGATGQLVTLRTMQPVSDFADLDTDYTMPKGYRSALSICLAERVANVLLGGIPPGVGLKAAAARRRVANFNCNPGIIGAAIDSSNIITGDA